MIALLRDHTPAGLNPADGVSVPKTGRSSPDTFSKSVTTLSSFYRTTLVVVLVAVEGTTREYCSTESPGKDGFVARAYLTPPLVALPTDTDKYPDCEPD